MGKQPKPWVAELGWAGIFLAFFVLNEYYETTPPEPKWASFQSYPLGRRILMTRPVPKKVPTPVVFGPNESRAPKSASGGVGHRLVVVA